MYKLMTFMKVFAVCMILSIIGFIALSSVLNLVANIFTFELMLAGGVGTGLGTGLINGLIQANRA